MRKKGDFEYGLDAEMALLSLITDRPKTTAQLAREMKDKFFSKIHYQTVQRLLNNLKRKGKVKWQDVGKMRLWHY